MATRQLTTKQVVNLASDPASGTPGEIYYNTVDNVFKYYNGSVWTTLTSGGGGASNSFTTIDVPNGTDPTADSATDTLTFTESNGIVITGDSSTDSIQFSTNATASNTASTIVARDADQSFDITAIDFDTADSIANATGRLHWEAEEGTLQLGMPDGVVQSIGMEFYMPPTKNNSGVEIPNGSFVMATGALGDRITIAKAVTNGTVDPMFMIGVATETIANESETGLITVNGTIRDVDTSAWVVGTVLYPDPANAGGFTSTQPSAPNIRTPIAIVLRQHENTGRIYVRMTNGSVLGGTDSNVAISSIADNHILSYNGTTGIWQNQGLAAAIQEVDGPGSGIDADTLDGKHASEFSSLSIGSSLPEAPENGALFFNQEYGIFYIGFGSSWLEIGSVPPLDGGQASTTIFASGILDGGDSTENTYNLNGGSSSPPSLLA